MEKLKIGVIFGGRSSEHEVSLVSATSILKNIDAEKYEIHMLGITKEGKWLYYKGPIDDIANGEWEKYAEPAMISPDTNIHGIVKLNKSSYRTIKLDVVFPVLHGLYGEDGTIQGLLEMAEIPYVGPGVLASAIGMDKLYSKIIFKNKGLPQCNYMATSRNDIENNLDDVVNAAEEMFGYPCFVKPSNSGSSVGINKAHNRQELIESLHIATKHDRKVLIEEFIDAREIECSVLGNDNPKASAVGEIVPGNEFYDYEAKYHNDNSKTIIPAKMNEKSMDVIRQLAIEAYKAIDARGMARVDFFIHKTSGRVYINEINTIPGFTNISMYPKLWEATGINYHDLIDNLISLALENN